MLRTSVYKTCSKCPPAALNACLKPFAKWQYCFISWALWQVRPDRLQDGLQLRNVRWLRYIALILVKHRTPHMIVKRVEIRRIRWPLFLPDKLWAISAKPVLRQWRCVSRSPVLLEDENTEVPDCSWRNDVTSPNPADRRSWCSRRAVAHQGSSVLLVLRWRRLDCIQLCTSSMHADSLRQTQLQIINGLRSTWAIDLRIICVKMRTTRTHQEMR